MAIEDPPGGVKPFARPYNLVRPPRDRQFRTAQLKVEREQRVAQRRLEAKLNAGGEACQVVYPPELAGIWNTFGYRELRRDLPPEAVEKLHRQLAAVLAGEEGAATVWWATLAALRQARLAAEVPIGAPSRKWRQVFGAFDYW